MKAIPPHATAAGIPAKILGKAKPADNSSPPDHSLLLDDCASNWSCVWSHILEKNVDRN